MSIHTAPVPALVAVLVLALGLSSPAQIDTVDLVLLDTVELEVGDAITGVIAPRPSRLPVSARGGAIARLTLFGDEARLEAFEEGDTVFALLDSEGRHVADLPVSITKKKRSAAGAYLGVTGAPGTGTLVSTPGASPAGDVTAWADQPRREDEVSGRESRTAPEDRILSTPVVNAPSMPRSGTAAVGAGASPGSTTGPTASGAAPDKGAAGRPVVSGSRAIGPIGYKLTAPAASTGAVARDAGRTLDPRKDVRVPARPGITLGTGGASGVSRSPSTAPGVAPARGRLPLVRRGTAGVRSGASSGPVKADGVRLK